MDATGTRYLPPEEQTIVKTPTRLINKRMWKEAYNRKLEAKKAKK